MYNKKIKITVFIFAQMIYCCAVWNILFWGYNKCVVLHVHSTHEVILNF
jgi:hypothetical protein